MKKIYKRHRFPPSIIQHAVWLYYRFNLSIRDVEDLLAERNISVSYEAIRLWINKFGPEFTKRLRRRHSGFDDSVQVGYEQIEIIMDITADCNDDELEELLTFARDHSPVCDTICRSVPVTLKRVK